MTQVEGSTIVISLDHNFEWLVFDNSVLELSERLIWVTNPSMVVWPNAN